MGLWDSISGGFGDALGSGLGTVGAGWLAQEVMGGGGGYDVKYAQSPESSKTMEALLPALEKVGKAGVQGKQLWEVPSAPMVEFGNLPGAPNFAPTGNWFGNLDPSIRQGMWAPYEAGSQQLMEQMGAGGMAGSARGGISGNAAAGLGKFWEKASEDVGRQGWEMMGPSRQATMAEWQQAVNRQNMAAKMAQNAAMQQWAQTIGAKQAPFGIIPGMAGGAMPTPMAVPSGDK